MSIVIFGNVTSPLNPVAHWKFNESTGSTTNDYTGHGHNGAITNATWAASGVEGYALYFNGTSAYVSVTDNAALDFTSGFTITAWVKPEVVSNAYKAILVKDNDGTNNHPYWLYASTSNASKAAGGFSTASSDEHVYNSAALTANIWSHIAVTYDGVSSLKFYLNGALVTTATTSGNGFATTGELKIGASAFGEYFQGWIDEVRIYNIGLSATDIEGIYNENSAGAGGSDTTADFYVSKSGNDSWNGTSPTFVSGSTGPKLTISAGIAAMSGGQVLRILTGTYEESFSTPPAGSSGDHTIIATYGGGTVTFTNNSHWDFYTPTTSYIDFIGNFIWDGTGTSSGESALSINNSHHIRFDGWRFHHWDHHGIETYSAGNEFKNCRVDHNGYHVINGQVGYGFYISKNSHNTIIEHCEIDNNGGYGIHEYSGYAGEFSNNCIFRYNKIHDNGGMASQNDPDCMLIGSGDNNVAYNNLLYDNALGNGISINYNATNCKAFNNTAYNCGVYGVFVGTGSDNAVVRNNISYNNSSNYRNDSGTTTADHNSTDGTNPQFLNVTTRDFHLTASTPSSIKDAGANLSTSGVTDDYDGVSRPQGSAYDIGAYEFV